MGDDGEKAYRPYRDNAGIEVARAPVQLIVHVLCVEPSSVASILSGRALQPSRTFILQSELTRYTSAPNTNL
ncbi:hypothetical protein AcW1_005557 [Taiwanofungus camphoratus]|nr:hypothetical protein AcW2_004326 [Antrodia cinnamomea]KAI0933845.1 hypothetical protein AcV5_005881 [Antrodia cinnamomea]KAI0957038.1 hypothetical protein AcW1_005557 [Antrodia cinnamomea]